MTTLITPHLPAPRHALVLFLTILGQKRALRRRAEDQQPSTVRSVPATHLQQEVQSEVAAVILMAKINIHVESYECIGQSLSGIHRLPVP
jgi:hypothetical protein